MNVKTIRWEITTSKSHKIGMRLSSILFNSTHFTNYTTMTELKFPHICAHTKKTERIERMSIHIMVIETPIYQSYISIKMHHDGYWITIVGKESIACGQIWMWW